MGALLLLACVAVSAGCGGGSAAPSDQLAGAASSALRAVNQLGCTSTLADLYSVEAKFVRGGQRALTVAKARRALRGAGVEVHDSGCTPKQRATIARVARRVRCDITASLAGKYCPS